MTTRPRSILRFAGGLAICSLVVVGLVYQIRADPWFLVLFGALMALGLLTARFPAINRTFTALLAYYMLFLAWMVLAFAPAVGALWLARFVIARSSLWPQVLLLVVWSVVLAILISFLATDTKRARLLMRLRPIGIVAPAAYAFNVLMVAVMFFGALTRVLMARSGLRLNGNPELVFDFYVWHFLEALPLLDVNETLRWDQPLTYDSAGVGWILLAFKIVVIVPVIAAFGAYWKYAAGRLPSPRPGREEEREKVEGGERQPAEHV